MHNVYWRPRIPNFFPECAHSSKASRVLTLVINPSSPTRSLSYFTILSRVTLEPHLNFIDNTLAGRSELNTCISVFPDSRKHQDGKTHIVLLFLFLYYTYTYYDLTFSLCSHT